MTPKEKAEELVDKYYVTIVSFLSDRMKNKNAKQCALIAVDQILKLYLNIGQHLEDDDDKMNYYSYWEEVKQEIEKL